MTSPTFALTRAEPPKECPSVFYETRRLLLACALAGAALSASAQALRVERVDLGDAEPGIQAYNLQEQRQLRVFARSELNFKRPQIFMQRRNAGKWQPAEPMPFADPSRRDSDPHLSVDGKVLTFVSDRAPQGDKPLGHLDLFESRFFDGAWTAPQRLPESLQSQGYELGPERYGQTLFFASAKLLGAKKLMVVRADLAEASPKAIALPAPINEGGENSDFTLSPDGRYALWWSSREGTQGGADIYLAERVGSSFGPAIRLPEPINGPAIEFTPSVSADGQWLLFASTRDDASGLSHMYRVSWPQLLQSLEPQAQAYSETELKRAVSALWRAFNHVSDQAADVNAMKRLLHPQAIVFGESLKDSQLGIRPWTVPQFLELLKEPYKQAQIECETRREVIRYGGHAQVYSVVQTRQDEQQKAPDFTGVNSMHWQLGPQGWQLLSLHYALESPGHPVPASDSAKPACMD